MNNEKANKYYVRHPAGNGFTMTTVLDTKERAIAFAVEVFKNELESGLAGLSIKVQIDTSVE